MTRARFVVAEVTGWQGIGGTAALPGLTVAVLDRAYCHHVVRSWRSELPGTNRPLSERKAEIREAAREMAERLNAGGQP